MTRNRLIRTLCVSLVLVILILALTLTLAMNLGIFDGSSVSTDPGHSEYTGPVVTEDYTFTDTITLPPITFTTPNITTTLGPGPGGDIGPLAGLLGGLLGGVSGALSDNTVLFTVSGDTTGPIYLKMQSYGDYTGQSWRNAQEYPELLYGKYSADYLRAFTADFSGQSRLRISQVVQKDPYSSSISYKYYNVAPYYLRYTSDEDIPTLESDTSVYIPFDKLTQLGISQRFYYDFFYSPESDARNTLSDTVLAYELNYRTFVHENYLALDDESMRVMTDFANSYSLSADDPDIIQKVADVIKQSGQYNLKYDNQLDKEDNVAVSFLTKYRQGVCSHFAAAATLLYRSLGIPARYTVGFLTDVKADNASMNVRASDAHAWVEVYEDGVGWERVEVTGGASQSCPGSGVSHNKQNCSSYYIKKVVEPTPYAPGYTVYQCTICSQSFSDDFTEYTGSTTQPPVNTTGPDITTQGPISLPSRLILKPKKAEKVYDGTPILATEIEGFPQDMLDFGYTYKVSFSGIQTEIGRSYSRIKDISIFSPTGIDVTDNFNILTNIGILQVYRGALVFASGDTIATYPNTAVTSRSKIKLISAPEGFDLSRYMVEYSVYSSDTIGTAPATFTVDSLYDPETLTNGLDEYMIIYQYGKLTVNPAKLVIRAGSSEKLYDGTPLTNSTFVIIEGQHPNQHQNRIYEIDIVGSQTDPGSSDNIIESIKIIDIRSNDVTHYYQIEFLVGKLTVLPKQ